MKVVKVIEFENGEVIYTTDLDPFADKITKEEFKNLKDEALKMYKNGEKVKGTWKKGETIPLPKYYDDEGNFLGNGGIHITSKSLDVTYLFQNDGSKLGEKTIDNMYKKVFNIKR